MYYKRTIEKVIKNAALNFPCISLYGSRQVGKSTTLQMLFPNINYITLDDSQDRALAISNPSLFLDTYGWPLLIDEINKAPQLFEEIKKRIDKQRFEWMKTNTKNQLMYILSGSNQFEIKESVAESLAGRTAVFTMSSFTLAEKNNMEGQSFNPDISVLIEKQKSKNYFSKNKNQIFEEIFKGGMPDFIVNNSDRNLFFKSYVDTFLKRDVSKLISIPNETVFTNFLSLVALRTGQVLNYDDISSSLGINMATTKRWLSILESANIITILQPYLSNLSNRITKTAKLYFMDTGLCAYLCKWPNSQMLQDCAMSGAFFETYVVSEMIKSLQNEGLDPKQYLYFYRDRDQKEVDIIYEKDGVVYPIEIKKGLTPSKPTKNFNVLAKFNKPIKPGLVIDSCEKIRPINELAYYCPVTLVSI